MIKFFRKIRQKLLEQNRVSKYLVYALGEIILVVIGILIALQINNWSERNKQNEKEKNYITNLQRDLKSQIAAIDNQIAYETDFIDKSIYLMNTFKDGNFIKLDSVFFENLSILQSRKTFLIVDPTYTDLLSSGNIDLIKNKDLKDELIQYYQELERIELVIQNNNSLLVDQQFATIFFEIAYYVSSDELNTSKYQPKTSNRLTTTYHKELEITSKDLLSIKENQLKLMNIISLKHSLSLGSLRMMKTVKTETEVLLNKLKI